VCFGSKCEILCASRCFPVRFQTQTLLDAIGTSHLCHKRTFSGVAAYFGKLTIILLTTGFVARNPAPLESNDRSGITSLFDSWPNSSVTKRA
jgi:hypothetical protein